MALLERLFYVKRKVDVHESHVWDRSRHLNLEQVRLLLFKECDWRGRKLLFDSASIERLPATSNDKLNTKKTETPYIVEIVDGYAYVYKGLEYDTSTLGEMIFGAVALSCKGVSLKIHIMDEPRRLMFTKLFFVPATRRVSKAGRKASDANCCGDTRLASRSYSIPGREDVALSFSMNRGDSGYCGDQSPRSSVSSTNDYFTMFDVWDGFSVQEELYNFNSPLGRNLSISSRSSWQRRISRNQSTRFDLGNQSTNTLPMPRSNSNVTSNDSQIYSNSSASGTSDSLSSNGSFMAMRKSKLGLAFMITVNDSNEMDFIRKYVEHSPQLQALVCRLRLATLSAGSGASFVATLYNATADAARWLSDLMYGPRIQPMWLSLVTASANVATKTAEAMLSDLCSVLSVGDTKNTNFFISTLLTHVLTYHLGWVTTVSPYEVQESQHINNNNKETSRPYNALWAQLTDLCGNIGNPPKMAKTIISGSKNEKFLNRLLVVLTYFVRCGDIIRTDHVYDDSAIKETKVTNINMKNIRTNVTDSLILPSLESRESDDSVSTIVGVSSMKRSTTVASLSHKLSIDKDQMLEGVCSTSLNIKGIRRNPTLMLSTLKSSSDSSLNSEGSEPEKKVVFVLGDDDKLEGLISTPKSMMVEKTCEVKDEVIINVDAEEKKTDAKENNNQVECTSSKDNMSKCCGQTEKHSKPIKHSGFKFEFDKYPQIVNNYMKSKNLEILDRHFIGKPGNLKLENYQFDPTFVPPIQEERCETCYKCQLMESTLQTPTNASEFEYMNDDPNLTEPQYAKETVEISNDTTEITPKTFIRKKKENTVVVNLINKSPSKLVHPIISVETCMPLEEEVVEKELNNVSEVKKVIEFEVPRMMVTSSTVQTSGYHQSLLGGVTDHYVPDLILQGTLAEPKTWESELRRDLDITTYMNKSLESALQAVAIVGDTNTWEVKVVGRDCGTFGMSALVGGMLDALPAMHRAKVPAHQCLSFLESKLREFCILSKTLADMLMTTDFCDIATLTKSLNIDINDVPLLLAVATTHTPQVASRYGISYR